jgi:hypothetical protein
VAICMNNALEIKINMTAISR